MLYKSLALVTAAVSLFATEAQSQTCTGNAPFSTGKYRGTGGVVFGDNVTTVGVGITLGMPKWFWGGSLGNTSFDGGGSSTDLGLSGGYQIMPAVAEDWYLCPVGSFTYQAADGGHITHLGLGGSIGSVVYDKGGWQHIPAGSFTFQRVNVTVDLPGGGSASNSEVYELLTFGWGFYRTQSKLNIMPTLYLPVGLNGASSSFGVTVSIGFGQPAS